MADFKPYTSGGYYFYADANGEHMMKDLKTGKVVKVSDAVGDQSKGDATAMACAEAGKGRVDEIEEV